MRLRTKVFILTAALLLFALAGILGVIQWNLKKDITQRTATRLEQARATFLAREDQRFLLLGTMARTLELNPSLRLIMNRTNRATLESYLEDVRVESSVDLILITDLQGGVLALRGQELESTSGLQSVEQALLGEEAIDYWKLGGSLYQVYSVPLTSGDLVDGTVSLATRIDDSVLERAAEEIGMEFVVQFGVERLAGSLDLAPVIDRSSTTVEVGDRTFTYRVVPLQGSARAELLILNDLSPSVALLKKTRIQLFLIGGLAFLLVLASSWPLIERVTVSSQLLETVVESVGEGLLQLDHSGHIVRVNPAGEKLLGLSTEQLLDQQFSEVVTILPEGIRPGEAGRLDDVTVKTEQSEFPASVVATPFKANSGHRGTVLIVRDISQAKQTEEQLRQAAQAKADFLAHMSHEIRTPMNGVLGMNALLLNTPLSPQQQRYATTIESAGQSLLKILNDVLDHSKLEAEAVDLEKIEFELWKVLEDVVTLLSTQAHDKSVELKLSIDKGTPRRVLGDPVRLGQVLINLVGNAIKFTSRGEVVVSANPQNDAIRFQVKDTGVGISPDFQKSLFREFAQADASTTRQYGGTGLGLSISAKLVRLMGGRIEVESSLGKGSCFWFDLPLVPLSSEGSEENPAHPEPPPHLSGQNTLSADAPLVLVVDDNHINLEVALASLAQLGYRGLPAENGREAIEVAQREDLAAILMDCEMPGLDGFETTRLIRDEKPEIPVVALTAAIKPSTHTKAEICGMNAVLLKPFKLEQLGQILAGFRPEAHSSGPAVLDLERLESLRSLRENEPDFVPNLIRGYLSRLEQTLPCMDEAASEQAWEKVSALAHRERGAAGNLGLESLKADCSSLEERADSESLESFRAACEEAKCALQEYLEKHGEAV